MEEKLVENELWKYFNEARVFIGEKNCKRYHLRTVENFIIHFNAIGSEDKEIVFLGLKEYLIFIKDIEYPKSSKDSNNLYNDFVYPLSSYYLNVGFRTYITDGGIIFIIILLEMPILILSGSILLQVLIIALLVFILSYRSKKIKQHKTFGYLW